MLSKHLDAAMKQAKYEILDDDKSYYGEIETCQGVYATTDTLEACREQLLEVLEEWMLFRIHKNFDLPVIDGIAIRIEEVA